MHCEFAARWSLTALGCVLESFVESTDEDDVEQHADVARAVAVHSARWQGQMTPVGSTVTCPSPGTG